MLIVFDFLGNHMKHRIIFYTSLHEDQGEVDIKLNFLELYPDCVDYIPPGIPESNRNHNRFTTFVDAYRSHALENRRSVTGLMMLFKKIPIQVYIRMQNRVETLTYGSDLVATKFITELKMAMVYKPRTIGFPIYGQYQILGENDSMVNICSIPSITLNNKHIDIAYHWARETIAASMINLVNIPRKYNPYGFMTNHPVPQNHYPLLK